VVNSGTLALGTYTYTPSGATSSTTQIRFIADSSMLTINSGGTFDISAITATPTTLKRLTISGGTINVAMDGSGNVSNIVLNSAAGKRLRNRAEFSPRGKLNRAYDGIAGAILIAALSFARYANM
jgi:hypothetical protein